MAIDLLATLKLKDDFSGPMGKAEKKMGSFGGAAKKLTGIVAGIGLGAMAVGFAKDITQTGIAFTDSMSQAAAVTEATGTELEGLTDLAMKMGKETVFSASESADAISYLGMAGFETEEIVAALPDTLALAAAGGLDLARAADIASNVMSGFNMMTGDVAGNMKRVSDVMAAAASSANTDVNQLGDAMSYAAPVMSAYGIALEESAAAVGIFSNAGIQGSRAGMSLKNVVSQLANPVGKTSDKLKELGLSAEDVNPEVNSLADILDTLDAAGAKATDAIALVGSEAGPAFASMMSVGSEGLREYTKELENSEGAAQSMAEIMTDNLGGDIKMLSSVWESFKLQLFFKQEGFMRDVLQGIAGFVEKLIDAIPIVEKFISKNKAFFKGLALAAGVLVTAVGAVVGFNLAMMAVTALASPIGLIVLAVSGIGIAFMAAYERIEPFRNAVNRVIDDVKMFFSILKGDKIDTSDWGLEDFARLFEMSEKVKTFKDAFDSLKKGLSDFADDVSERFSGLVERFSGYGERLGEFWEDLSMAFETGSEGVGDVLTSLWNLVGPIFTLIFNALQIIGDIAMWAFEFVIIPLAGLVAAAFSATWSILGPILDLLGAALEVVANVALWLWDNALKPLADYLGGSFSGAVETATGIIEGIGGAFEWVGDRVSSVAEMVRNFADLISNIKVPDWISNAVGRAVRFVTGGGSSHYHGLENVPYDGYSANLHKGERVLTAQENRAYESGNSSVTNNNGVTITGNEFNVRQESDIEKIAYQLAKLIEREGGQMA